VPGDLLVVSAPSGAGKTTLLKRLLAEVPGLRFSVSHTTRPPRPGEVHGRDYFFVSPEEFRRLQESGGLLEWVTQFGYCYGTSREAVSALLEQGFDVICDVEVRGAKAIRQSFPAAVCIFILPPDLTALEERLQQRGGLSPEELSARLAQGRGELKEAPWYDFLVLNDELDTALDELRAIVLANRCRAPRLWPRLASRFGW
jgi:guanylate kinase